MAWTADQVSFELIVDDTDAPVATARIFTPDGEILVMADVAVNHGTMILTGLHMHHVTVGANAIGPGNLRALARIVMKRLGYDEIIIEGGTRTTGAGKGRRPRIRFAAAGDHSGPESKKP